eukprot:CAMPEP_0172484434 /NCGR_PEP_ID=MMETSP1066-20121228/11905_1 /TAXON_ID=671091 /ORGANISM="Coscinodiscus wailesii, Strain CCMP2513" /LENGTH=207 /DNA_ID=CAMNT_0013248969 /DNA_START=349 /DNA_END=972 /DNA_ORIENTATION=-
MSHDLDSNRPSNAFSLEVDYERHETSSLDNVSPVTPAASTILYHIEPNWNEEDTVEQEEFIAATDSAAEISCPTHWFSESTSKTDNKEILTEYNKSKRTSQGDNKEPHKGRPPRSVTTMIDTLEDPSKLISPDMSQRTNRNPHESWHDTTLEPDINITPIVTDSGGITTQMKIKEIEIPHEMRKEPNPLMTHIPVTPTMTLCTPEED